MHALWLTFCLMTAAYLPPSATPGHNPLQFVLSLARDPQGDVWVGTEADGVWRCDPNGRWRQFTTADGLGENSGTALVCDRRGRIWVGHRTQGVSVFNGRTWRNYDALTGPLGGRVFAMAVNPADGDVWMATDRGLARWSETMNAWAYSSRATGLPDDEANAIAFGRDGTLYLGTQDSGIAIASPDDDYQTWRVVPGPPRPPDAPMGRGLPSPLINALLVSHDGALYAGTTCGLAGSLDGGRTWRYLRGQDWLAKAQQQASGPPAALPAPTRELLTEDYVTSLAEDGSGLLWVGHRHTGTELYDPRTGLHAPLPEMPLFDFVRALIVPDGQFPWIGDYGMGLFAPGPAPAFAAPQALPFPAPAQAPDAATLAALTQDAEDHATPLMPGEGEFLGDDWATQGDWVGRYGEQYAILYGMESPSDQVYAPDPGYSLHTNIGTHYKGSRTLWSYISRLSTDDPRILYDPAHKTRRDSEINDGSWQFGIYPRTWDGPDLWVVVQVPSGLQRVSLYFVNDDGHTVNSDGIGDNRLRDYTVELRGGAESVASAEASPDLAHTRVFDFYDGVYKRFLVEGPGKFFFRIGRNNSFVTKLQGVFMDRETSAPPAATPNGLTATRYAPPPADLPPSADATLAAAQALWAALDAAQTDEGGAALDATDRILAYRAAVGAGAPPALLANWRWALDRWTPRDRSLFDQAAQLPQALAQP